MATTTTTIWEGHGLEVRRQVTNNAAVMQAAPGSPTTFEALVEIELVLYRRMHYPPQQVLARVFSEKQIRKIEKNSDSWAMGIVHQSVRRARNRALRCHNALTAAQQAEDRWIALAEPFGIRPDEERMVEVPHRARRLGQMVDTSGKPGKVLWEGHGLVVRYMPTIAAQGDPTWIRGLLQFIMLEEHQPGEAGYRVIAYSRCASQEKIGKNPEGWVRSVLRRRLRAARADVERCERKHVDAQANNDRWAEIAGRFGIQH